MAVPLDILLFLLAFVGGYSHASLVESWCHDKIWHARKKTLQRSKKLSAMGGTSLQKASQSHQVVHHGMSFRQDHTTQFQSRDEELRAQAYFQNNGLPLANQFGMTVDRVGFLRFMAPFMVLNSIVLATSPFLFAVPFVLTSLLPALCSTYVHRYMHQPIHTGIATASLPIRILLRSRIGQNMWTHHFLHHRHPRACFNLGVPVGDWLRGVSQQPTPAELEEIRQLGGPKNRQ